MGKSLQPYLEIGNTDFILQFLKQNTGITFLPRFTVEKANFEGYDVFYLLKSFLSAPGARSFITRTNGSQEKWLNLSG